MKLHFWFGGTSRQYAGQVPVSRSMGHVQGHIDKMNYFAYWMINSLL